MPSGTLHYGCHEDAKYYHIKAVDFCLSFIDPRRSYEPAHAAADRGGSTRIAKRPDCVSPNIGVSSEGYYGTAGFLNFADPHFAEDAQFFRRIRL